MNDRDVELEELVRRARLYYDDFITKLADTIEDLMDELAELKRDE